MFRHECDYNSKDSKIVMLWRTYNVIKEMVLVAIALAVATNAVPCSNKVDQGEIVDINKVPRQVIGGMYAVQTNNGGLQMRLEADLMERFQNDSTNESYELFPEGFKVYAYNEEGLLETHIYSDIAKHTTIKDGEKWEAYGNVVVENYIKGQQLFTDTLYWDREEGKIYTDCLVEMYSPDGYMKGYGMESDEMARNASILVPFDSYAIIGDSLSYYVDTANFIGPVARPNPIETLKLTQGDADTTHKVLSIE